MLIRRSLTALLAIVLTSAMGAAATVAASAWTPAVAQKPATPKAGTAARGLLDGLKAVHANDSKTFIAKHCSKKKLCSSTNATKNMMRYNWPSARRMTPKCLKGTKHDTLIVTKVKGDESKDDQVRVFISCIDGQSARPYKMHKDGGVWKLANLF